MRTIAIVAMLLAAPVMAAAVPDYGQPVSYEDGVKIGEAYAKSDLLDPYSAKFEWPYSFVAFDEKLPLFKRTTGYATCFTENAKNSMGGYIGVRIHRLIIRDGRVIEDAPIPGHTFGICQELIDKNGMQSVPTAPHP